MSRGGVKFKIEGLKETQRALKRLDERVVRRVLRGAVRKAAVPMLHAARSNAPIDTGLLVSQLRISTTIKRFRGGKGGAAYARIIAKASRGKADAFYGAFVEYGTSRMPPYPFLQPAYDGTKETSFQILLSELKAGTNRAVKLEARKAIQKGAA